MTLKDIFGKLQKEENLEYEDDYIELDVPSESSSGKKVLIKVDKLEDYTDSDRIQKKVREGNIMLVKIKDLKDEDMGELKRAINRIRKTVIAVNGDIAGVSDEWLVVTPHFAKVHREGEARSPQQSAQREKSGQEEEKEEKEEKSSSNPKEAALKEGQGIF